MTITVAMNARVAAAAPEGPAPAVGRRGPTPAQRRWRARGLSQPGGKLPLFDEVGRAIGPKTIGSCVRSGWAEPWIYNPVKPDWLVCKLTPRGRGVLGAGGLDTPAAAAMVRARRIAEPLERPRKWPRQTRS